MRYFYGVLLGMVTQNALSADADQCIAAAAQYHRVNAEVLRSILNIESGFKPGTVSKNTDQSIDVGMGGTNSIHFPELAKFGITPQHLLAPCNSIFTTAWLLGRAVRRHGESWYGYAAFHSTTPYFNSRYQILIHNDLVRRGRKNGTLISVPPLKAP
ncbi:lytic transglycosylase domain-containing protein [Paracidovorax wautersii]